jgi:hypothetical protein
VRMVGADRDGTLLAANILRHDVTL